MSEPLQGPANGGRNTTHGAQTLQHNFLRDSHMHRSQRGIGLISLMLFGIAAFFIVVMVVRVLPSYMEYLSIERVFSAMVTDPALSGAPPSAIRDSFNRRSQIDNITSINGSDLKIDQGDNRLNLSASYHVEKPIFGNVGIYIDFAPTTSPATQ